MTAVSETPGPIPARWAPYLLGVLRIVTAALFVTHGTQKLFGIPGHGSRGPVELTSLVGIAGVMEALGGALVLVGLCTRPVAFLLAGEMAAAYFITHAARGFWPLLNGGELATLFCFLFLYIAAAGGGAWTLDGRRK